MPASMRCVYFQCANGVSGDMVLGALVDAGVPLPRLQDAVDSLGPEMPRLEAETVLRAGIRATLVRVRTSDVNARPRSLRQLLDAVEMAQLPAPVKGKALQVIRRLGEAEARVHGLPSATIELEELGSTDTLADIVGSVAGLAELGAERVFSSALPVGSGRVRTHHGLLPVPVPGVLELVREVNAPVLPPPPEDLTGELVTPTGAALVTTLATFQDAPAMALDRVGYGAGTRDPQDRPNVLVLWVGEAQIHSSGGMVLVETTIDDMNPEIYGHVRELLMAQGARDVWLAPVQMKKNRPGVIITAIGPVAAEGSMVSVLLRETSTLGVRVMPVRRHEVAREVAEIDTPLGRAHVKLKHLEGRIVDATPEYEDCRTIAQERGLPLQEVYRIVQRSAEDRFLQQPPHPRQ